MVKEIFSNIKSIFASVFAIIMALCFGFAALGCEKDEAPYEYEIRIAKEQFGCERILWYGGGGYKSELTGVYLYDTHGHVSLRPRQSLFEEERSGTYVLGVDKHGYEKFIAIPSKKSTKDNSKLYSPRLIQWPFSYSFTEIAGFAAEHGYKYADGMDNYDRQPPKSYTETFGAIDCKERFVRNYGIFFENAEEKYATLDTKLALYYEDEDEDGTRIYYFIMQEGGQLNLYEVRKPEDEVTVNIITYEHNKQDAES